MQHRNNIAAYSIALLGLVCTMGHLRPAMAQDTEPSKNTLYAELGGNALVYSLNYDRIFADVFSVRAGIGYFRLEDELEPGSDNSVKLAGIPVVANYLLGSGVSRLELGVGILILTGRADLGGVSTSKATIIGTGSLAYRYQKPMGGLFFKAGFTPFIVAGAFAPWFGASIGYTL